PPGHERGPRRDHDRAAWRGALRARSRPPRDRQRPHPDHRAGGAHARHARLRPRAHRPATPAGTPPAPTGRTRPVPRDELLNALREQGQPEDALPESVYAVRESDENDSRPLAFYRHLGLAVARYLGRADELELLPEENVRADDYDDGVCLARATDDPE